MLDQTYATLILHLILHFRHYVSYTWHARTHTPFWFT